MIRHRCAVCARAINRTDHLFETSDGTLCRECLARLASGNGVSVVALIGHNPLPLFGLGYLPDLAPFGGKQG